MERFANWFEKKSGVSQVMTLVLVLYAVSTPIAVLAGFLAR